MKIMTSRAGRARAVWSLCLLLASGSAASAAERSLPPRLPGGEEIVTDSSPEFLKVPGRAPLADGVVIAREPPSIDFMFYSGQDHKGAPWSNWSDGTAVGDRYYSAISDHQSPRGTALVYEYDRKTRRLRLLCDVRRFLESTPGALPEGSDYTPGKIHSRVDLGSDGMLYLTTHRGSGKTTDDAHGFMGDWLLRVDPQAATTDIVAAFPIPKHCIPAGILDSTRMVYYGGTTPGTDAPDKGIWFFAYDITNRKMLLTSANGFARNAIVSPSQGRVWWGVGESDRKARSAAKTEGFMYDHATNRITPALVPHVRSATRETADGWVYGTSGWNADLWAFNVKTAETKTLGNLAAGRSEYITSIDVDSTGRYLYYVPGAHGGASADGTPIMQYDTRTGARKVIAFVADYYGNTYGYIPDGSFGAALSPDDATLYVTCNEKGWHACALMAVHIPASERQP
ncbi:MAG: hypothetical protein EBZ59_00850 [Planctomycetia bacterium]|nr:hypothetical protein [Planctomycetia bacterium]